MSQYEHEKAAYNQPIGNMEPQPAPQYHMQSPTPAPQYHMQSPTPAPGQLPAPGQIPLQPMPVQPMPVQPMPVQAQSAHPAPAPQVPQGQKAYTSVTPIPALNRGAAPVDCPACGTRNMTAISYEVGNTTHLWAAAVCICFCLGCLPYLFNGLKDVCHRCSNCGTLLATWHRSGSVEVHYYGAR